MSSALPGDPVAAAAGEWLAGVQLDSGALPWERHRHTDPWDHVEAAMGLDVAGRHDEAERAYAWLAATQEPSGGWYAAYRPDGSVEDDCQQSGYNGYVAVGVWHHLLATSDEAYARRMWPTVARALDWVLDMQAPDGTVGWARATDGSIDRRSLVTGSSSLVQALRTGARLGDHLGDARPDWELAADRLGHALSEHSQVFWDRSRWAMDWYYPVLGGVLRGDAGRRRIDERWDRFVRRGRGTRCVSDEPWFTVAETCELAVALDAVGRRDDALAMVAGGHRLHDAPSGAWWTGWVDDDSPDGALWPEELTTWTAGAVLLALDTLHGAGPTSSLWREVAVTPATECDEHCRVGAAEVLEIDAPGAVSEAGANAL